MWRGPRGDGTSIEKGVPIQWDATDNIAWKVKVPGRGYASPIVWRDRVFLVTCIEETKERILLCLDRKTGETMWQAVVVRAPLEAMHRLNSYASSTPATDGEFVYVSFLEPDGSVVPEGVIRKRSGELRGNNKITGLPVNPGQMFVAAYDMNGNRMWVARPGEFASVWGYCSNPVLFEDKVILNGDHDGDAYIVALDRKTGETAWKVARENRIRSYATPLIRTIDGRSQMMVAGSHSIVSYSPRDGSKHWFTKGPMGRAVASPVFNGDLLFVCAAYPTRQMLAIRPNGRGDVTETYVAWRCHQSCAYVPSPIAVDDFFLVVSDNGTASCFDAASGKRHWRERIGKGHSASLVSAGGLVHFLSDEGVTKIVRPGKLFQLIAENSIGEHCYTSPAISRGQIFLRSEKHLFCVGRRLKL